MALLNGSFAVAVLDLLADSPKMVPDFKVVVLQVGVLDGFDLQQAIAEC